MWLKRGLVLLEGCLHGDVDVRLEEGRIAELGACPDGEQALDLCGRILSPGLIDMHIHGFAGRDAMMGGDSLDVIAGALAAHGVTAFCATLATGTPEQTQNALRQGRACACFSGAPGMARCAGFHMEGVFFCRPYRGAHNESLLREPSVALWERYVGGCEADVRIAALAPELPSAQELIRHLRGRGIAVSMAHTDATFEQAAAAVEAGASHATHAFNGMRSLHHREPGMIGLALTDERVTCEMIADGIHLHPAVLRLIARCKGAQRVALITDCMAAGGLGDGVYELGGLSVSVRQGVARIDAGNLAGSTLTLEAAVRNAVVMAGVSPAEALTMATATPAAALGLSGAGHIRAGYPADLAVFDAEFRPAAVFLGGREAFGRIVS